jgi:hypothetical protein
MDAIAAFSRGNECESIPARGSGRQICRPLPRAGDLGLAFPPAGAGGYYLACYAGLAKGRFSKSYGVKYPLIVRAVSFGEFTTTRTGRHSFVFPKSDT